LTLCLAIWVVSRTINLANYQKGSVSSGLNADAIANLQAPFPPDREPVALQSASAEEPALAR